MSFVLKVGNTEVSRYLSKGPMNIAQHRPVLSSSSLYRSAADVSLCIKDAYASNSSMKHFRYVL